MFVRLAVFESQVSDKRCLCNVYCTSSANIVIRPTYFHIKISEMAWLQKHKAGYERVIKERETGTMTWQTLLELVLACFEWFTSLLSHNIFQKSSCLFPDLPNLCLSSSDTIWCNAFFYTCIFNNCNGIWFLLSREFEVGECWLFGEFGEC